MMENDWNALDPNTLQSPSSSDDSQAIEIDGNSAANTHGKPMFISGADPTRCPLVITWD